MKKIDQILYGRHSKLRGLGYVLLAWAICENVISFVRTKSKKSCKFKLREAFLCSGNVME